MPRLAVFPKCYMDALCVTRSLTLEQWIDMAATLGVDGLELYPGFLRTVEPEYLESIRAHIARQGMVVPMYCYSPDFTHPDPAWRAAEVERQLAAIDVLAAFGAPGRRTCRVLSGQRRPEVTRRQGIAWTRECIQACVPHAERRGVVLAMENHYKDNFWEFPEFAQHLDVFVEIALGIDSPWFGVNYDPSNALLAGEDPLVVLDHVLPRVVSMHASDRHLLPGHDVAELRTVEDSVGYAQILHHGEVGRGQNDYDAIFSRLASVGFDGWISIEDGMDGMEELRRSADFLRGKLDRHFPAPPADTAKGG